MRGGGGGGCSDILPYKKDRSVHIHDLTKSPYNELSKPFARRLSGKFLRWLTTLFNKIKKYIVEIEYLNNNNNYYLE